MRTKLVAAVSAGAAAVAVVTLMAGAAAAAVKLGSPPPAPPTTAYPKVTIKSGVCPEWAEAVNAARKAYDSALKIYESDVRLFDPGPGRGPYQSAEKTNMQATRVDQAAIALIEALYGQAKCQNDAANPADKCIDELLAYYKLADQLPATQNIQNNDLINLNMAKNSKYATPSEIAALQKDYAAAAAATAKLVDQIAAQKKAAIEKGCMPPPPPTPAPTKSSTPPSSPSPSPTTSGSPTPTPTPRPSTTTAGTS
jgi:hypothetical protein